tara:strand:- start:16779 stop:19589 length:2811 start_codon:yes stop_codon:yes gene_type:complete
MPRIGRQKIEMTAMNHELQGSLFSPKEDEALNATKPLFPIGKEALEQELSDEQLSKDAQLRPRISQKQEIKGSIESNKQGKERSLNPDLPAWSHHNLVDSEELTPVLRHYVELKKENPERILLYRLGDFFECFFEDAIKLSQILELTLTGKEGGKSVGRVPMAGIPHHAAERYCGELIKKGLSVALCDQLESSPSKGGALLKRGITRIITPGTIIEEGMLQARRNNWLGAVLIEIPVNKTIFKWGLASADVSTGEFLVREGQGEQNLRQEILKLEASEVICSSIESSSKKEWCPENLSLTEVSKTPFNLLEAETSIKKHFKLSTVNGIGLNQFPLALRSAGGLIDYLNQTKPNIDEKEFVLEASQIALELPKICTAKEILLIDAQTRRNLEITSTQKDSQFQGSLLWSLDRTLTSMGGRCLRRWIEEPLIDINAILARQKIVSMLVENKTLRNDLRRLLRTMGDLERLAGRAAAGQASGRDLVAIADGLERLPLLSIKLQNHPNNPPSWFKILIKVNPELKNLAQEIRNNLISHPPLSLTEGGLINDGIDLLLDGLRNQLDDQNKWLKSQEEIERKISGINNLRLQYHRTFGYFLSVNKSKANNVPKHWIRRQTLANEERFITPDLKSREGKIFSLKARSAQREYELFCGLRKIVGEKAQEIRKYARGVAGLDALAGLSEIAAKNGYCKPQITKSESKSLSRIIDLKKSRHPVVEQLLVEKNFQDNDVKIGKDYDLIILTGPNASGKSCYLRQIGLIQLMAQIGSWIPAKEGTLSIADRIFTRVGAVDDLAAGQSTFIVEMAETAFILNQATENSLVLLDEIGRGTSTFDGLSIAWSVSEYLAKTIQSRTIFATHYHELNELTNSLKNSTTFQVLVKETGEDLIFLHKITPGGAHKSYGIEAARLAGVPRKVLDRAKVILKKLQEKELINKINASS